MTGEAKKRSDMTVAPEHPSPATPAEPTMSLIDMADFAARRLPGHRVEILGGQLIATPSADGAHAKSLTNLTLALAALHGGETSVVQAVGVWLPTGGDEHAVPDLAVVDADFLEHEVKYSCYDPAVFRLVLEVTSTNWRNDLEQKPGAYARAGIPVYVIGDRQHGEVVVLTDPHDGEYRTRSTYKKGETFTLPETIGAKVELETDSLLLS